MNKSPGQCGERSHWQYKGSRKKDLAPQKSRPFRPERESTGVDDYGIGDQHRDIHESNQEERFREIEITLAGPSPPPAQWPAAWFNAETSAAVVRFVDTQFQQERTLAEVRRLFGEVQRISVNSMPLRAIFVTLAKAGRKAA